MTPKLADQIIASKLLVTVRSKEYNETFTAIFIKRDRRTIETADGGKFDRADLEVVYDVANIKI